LIEETWLCLHQFAIVLTSIYLWVSGASLAYQELDTILKKVHIDGRRSQSLSEEDSEHIQKLIEAKLQLAKCHFQCHYGSYVCLRPECIMAFPLFHLCQAFDGSKKMCQSLRYKPCTMHTLGQLQHGIRPDFLRFIAFVEVLFTTRVKKTNY
jgi:hypothetical protein